MNNEHVSSGAKSDGKNLGPGKSGQEKTEFQAFKKACKEAVKSWVSRLFSTEPKAQDLPRDLDLRTLRVLAALELARRKRRAEDSLRANGFHKNLDGAWVDKDWWKPKN